MSFKQLFIVPIILIAYSCGSSTKRESTEITKWQYGKAAAVSLTFDDGTRNQFSVALPLLNASKLPATFYIITGEVEGSKYHGKFIGRPVAEIIAGTADTLTNKDNFFERASAIPFLGFNGALRYHSDAGSLFEQGKVEEAYRLIDSGYRKVRNKELVRSNPKDKDTAHLTWEKVKEYAAQGHEFASHTVTHPRLAVLTEPNILWELEKSKEDIHNNLGAPFTFSAECPYGTENERVMEYAYKIYPSLRNRMPEKYLAELNRASKENPSSRSEEYIQWQRGAVTKTPLPMMKSWVDTVASRNNQWLVLVFHGVDGIGWEALPGSLLKEYFEYIQSKNDKLWVATFADATKYMRERMNATVNTKQNGDQITIDLTHSLDKEMYNLPLTLRTYVGDDWQQVQMKQGDKTELLTTRKDDRGSFVMYQLQPNAGTAELVKQ
jgi:peptidoglycan/xylan/chitin deacetylase (PgdA/CDA1 family)